MEQQPPSSTESPPPATTAPATTTQTTTTTNSPTSSEQPISTTSSSLPLQPLPPSSNPNPKLPNLPHPQSINPMLRTPYNRPWQQNSPPFPHFPSITNQSTTPSSLTSIPPAQRGGMALGVPAHGPSPQPPTSFSSLTPPSFVSQYAGLGRSTSVSVPESVPSTSTSQVRQPMPGMQGAGMMGSLGPTSSMRPTVGPVSHPQRPLQSSLRPQAGANNQTAAIQNFQEHSLSRLPSAGSPGSPSPTTPQNSQPHNQPWLASGSQGKPPLPPPSFRPPMNPQSLQQRSHIPSQHQSTISTSTPSLQSQPSSLSQQLQEHYSLPPSRVPQTLTHQQQMARNRGLGNQRPFTPPLVQSPSVPPPPPFNKTPAVVEADESCNRIVSKRSIQEIVTQIDPNERLDPEVEAILVDIAEEFVESVTTFACSLAKHRKSTTLESKDVLLHLERNWNMSLPGFGGDEIKCYKKPFVNEVHRERIAAIKRSIAAAEVGNSKNLGGQTGGSGKGHPTKGPGVTIGSPNPKVREAA